jgi:ribose 5-phosphate isomerase B
MIMNKRVVIGNDHGAIELKAQITEHLEKRGYEVVDVGVNLPDSVDYPDIAERTCTEFLAGDYEFGIVCCGTGIGISIAANKFKGIRCALPQNIFAAQMAKEHNDANFIAFGGRIAYGDSVTDMLDAFMDSEHQGGRHSVRIGKIADLEA